MSIINQARAVVGIEPEPEFEPTFTELVNKHLTRDEYYVLNFLPIITVDKYNKEFPEIIDIVSGSTRCPGAELQAKTTILNRLVYKIILDKGLKPEQFIPAKIVNFRRVMVELQFKMKYAPYEHSMTAVFKVIRDIYSTTIYTTDALMSWGTTDIIDLLIEVGNQRSHAVYNIQRIQRDLENIANLAMWIEYKEVC